MRTTRVDYILNRSPTCTCYEKELGKDLLRKFVFFFIAVDSIELVDAKSVAIEVERKLGRRDGERFLRMINIDPDYITQVKFVLT